MILLGTLAGPKREARELRFQGVLSEQGRGEWRAWLFSSGLTSEELAAN